MQREIMTTGDGSKTIHMPLWNEQYHSKHGALQEAQHVFIQMGLEFYDHTLVPTASALRILEYGFGTGLNAMLTALYKTDKCIEYTGVEAYPIKVEEVRAMDYGNLLQAPQLYEKIHAIAWEVSQWITPNFQLCKKETTFEKLNDKGAYDLIYFDAFGPRTQPELWSQDIFNAAYQSLNTPGVLVTYCAAGHVRRSLEAAGFIVERLPGPPGKREMLRGVKS